MQAEECWHESLTPLLRQVNSALIEAGRPVYISFDIDSLDPAFAPGKFAIPIGFLRKDVWV